MLAGIEPGRGPRHELFVYVEDADATIASLGEAGETFLREAAEMPWGERVRFRCRSRGQHRLARKLGELVGLSGLLNATRQRHRAKPVLPRHKATRPKVH